ncbi:glucose-6-phosphate isomerase, partial [Streptomyces sp. NPDC127092]
MTTDLTRTPIWEKLAAHQSTVSFLHLRDLFATDPNRGSDLTVTAGDLYVDYSKHRVTRETLGLLLELARAAGLEQHRDAMFSGVHVNCSEDRAVLHTA